MLVYNSSNRASSLFDFRETAPASATQNMFQANPSLVTTGLGVAIPGELRGYEMAWAKYGTLTWEELFLPAIGTLALLRIPPHPPHQNKYFRWYLELANGFTVSTLLAQNLVAIQSVILNNPTWAAIYAPGGVLAQEGDIITNAALANTLELISLQGASAFYNGTLAQTMVQEINNAGGNVSVSDFAKYAAKERRPLTTYYHGRKILTGGSPTRSASSFSPSLFY